VQHFQLTKAIDDLGEEVAQDINSFEQMIKGEGEKIVGLSQQLNSIVTELKVTSGIVQSLNEKKGQEKFSENLVKQLIRQGEDRKTSIEETKLI
jgi:hypothetical protein